VAHSPLRDVRDLIDQALVGGQLRGPDGVRTQWQLRSGQPSAVAVDETDHAQRLVRG
jgi:hypothetical protein